MRPRLPPRGDAGPLTGRPDISVVVATHNRAELLRGLLAGLRRQTLARERFEVVIVDDASGPETGAVLEEEAARGELDLRPLRTGAPSGAPAARNRGWRAARAPVVAFTDDDCTPSPDWLAEGLATWQGDPRRIVQGRTQPAGGLSLSDFSPLQFHSIEVQQQSPEVETCNVFYPRELLEQTGGFEEGAPVGEDTELAWTAIEMGAHVAFAPGALVEHAVVPITVRDSLRKVWKWHWIVRSFARHPELRRTRLMKRVFWNWSHYLIARALIGLLLARSRWLWPITYLLVKPLVKYELEVARRTGRTTDAALWLLRDVVEMIAIVRGAVRYRTLVL